MEPRHRFAVACKMALLAWRAGLSDVAFSPLYELVDWPTSQVQDTGDQDLETMTNFAVRLGDAVVHGAPPLKGLDHDSAMQELEDNLERLEQGLTLSAYARSFDP